MLDKNKLIKVIVVSQSIKLNGKMHTLISDPVGTVIDAEPIYGDIHKTIIGYKDCGYNRKIPLELFKPVAKHRQEQIDSIFED